MSFHSALALALTEDPSAVAVFFLDDNGEVVDSVLPEGVAYDTSVVGAYLEIHLRKLRDVAVEWGDAPSDFIHFEKGQFQYMAAPLPDGYFVVVVHPRPAVIARGKRALSRTVESVTKEFFAH
jgi:hypothetical protein